MTRRAVIVLRAAHATGDRHIGPHKAVADDAVVDVAKPEDAMAVDDKIPKLDLKNEIEKEFLNKA